MLPRLKSILKTNVLFALLYRKGFCVFALREKSYLLDFSYFFALTSKVLVCNRDN